MDITTIIGLFVEKGGLWAGLSIILLGFLLDMVRRDERSTKQSLELLAQAFEAFCRAFQAHDQRSERMVEMLTKMDARRED